MSGIKTSSRSSADIKIKSCRIAYDRLVLPDGLFDERVPPAENPAGVFPPVIVYKSSANYVIIDGCKRYRALNRRRNAAVACCVVQTTLDSVKAGHLRIAQNAGRPLHPREKLLFIGWLMSHAGKKEYLKQCDRLPIPANERHEYEQLLQCRPWLIEPVMDRVLDIAVAPEMNHLPETDAAAMIRLFSSLSFSRQMQRELAEWLPEIAFLRKTTLPELLASPPFAAVPTDDRLNDPQKVAKFHELAHAIRFPLYAETKKSWEENIRKINPAPQRVSFFASPYFEKNSLEIRIKTEDAGQIHEIIRQLATVELVKWQELINPSLPASPFRPVAPCPAEENAGRHEPEQRFDSGQIK